MIRRNPCLIMFLMVTLAIVPQSFALDAEAIGEAADTQATTQPDGVVRIGWSRSDVEVLVDGMPFKPQAGLGSWAAFKESQNGAMVMGDTVVFQDEVDAAMDAAFAGGLEITALHNHFFYDTPKVYFMHIGGQGDPVELAAAVKDMWDAIKVIRSDNPIPALRFPGPALTAGNIDAAPINEILGTASKPNNGVVKVAFPREGKMHGITIGGTMGLSSWAAFSGNDDRAAMDGDFIMTGPEVQPVLQAMRVAGIHVVALHNHMTDEDPHFYFTHFWAVGSTKKLAQDFKSVLDAQANVR
ncbi:MAG: DUF1259 domain-containing protein [Candidatus Hydrogenedentota bacterium]